MAEEPTINHEERDGNGAFLLLLDGERIGEMTYTRTGPERVNIDHTGVRSEFGGRGYARKLLDAAVAWARESHTSVTSTCSYSNAQFERDASIRDVLV
jgi:predicted GNAT family acetyltransferase